MGQACMAKVCGQLPDNDESRCMSNRCESKCHISSHWHTDTSADLQLFLTSSYSLLAWCQTVVGKWLTDCIALIEHGMMLLLLLLLLLFSDVCTHLLGVANCYHATLSIHPLFLFCQSFVDKLLAAKLHPACKGDMQCCSPWIAAKAPWL